MKKFIAAILAVFMLVSCFAACGDDKKETTPKATTPSTPKPTTPSSPNGGNPDNPDPDVIVFDDVDETVYVDVYTLTLRTSTEISEANVKTYVQKDTALRRTGYHKDWSRVEFEGETVYCKTSCLTTVNPNPEITVVFTDVNETVYIDTTAYKQEDGTLPSAKYYLFPVQDVEEYIAGYLDFGTAVTRTGVYYEPVAEGETDEGLGWSRIVIGEDTFYIRNSVVSTTAPDGTVNTTPAGYTLYQNSDICFFHPESWSVVDSTPVMIVDASTGNNIVISYEAKSDIYVTLTTDAYIELVSEDFAAMGIQISNVSVEQVKTANGENVTKITQTAKTADVPAGMDQTLLVIESGDYHYTVSITEVSSASGLVDTVFGSLKSVK